MRPLIVSSSGTRAIVGENLHPKLGMDMAMAFGSFVGKGPVIVGGDTRVSYDMVKGSVISGLLAVGTDVIDIGKVPTPTVQQMIKHHNAAGGIVITASHNPIMWNGIKLMNETGSFLTSDQYDKYHQMLAGGNFKLAQWDDLGLLKEDNKALQKHVDLVLSIIDPAPIKNSGLKVLIDANNGTGALIDPILMDKLGVEYEIMNSEPDGKFAHDPEPLKGNLSGLIERLKAGDFDIGFVQDADADRLVILAGDGTFIGEDYSLAFCVDYILSQIADVNKRVVVNLSTSMVIDAVAKKHNATVDYTKIGEPNVTARLKEIKAQVGGEGNGGVIYPKVGWGRDSLVGIVIALKHLAAKKKTVSEIVGEYPKFVMLREKVAVSNREEIKEYLGKVEQKFPDAEKNKEDGIKIIFPNAWIHVRPSNTEPIVRVFIEAPTQEAADSLMAKVKG
jgi:phosphomannomutase